MKEVLYTYNRSTSNGALLFTYDSIEILPDDKTQSTWSISRYCIGFLLTLLMGAKGKKNEKLNYKTAFGYIVISLLIYFPLPFFSSKTRNTTIAINYMSAYSIGL